MSSWSILEFSVWMCAMLEIFWGIYLLHFLKKITFYTLTLKKDNSIAIKILCSFLAKCFFVDLPAFKQNLGQENGYAISDILDHLF